MDLQLTIPDNINFALKLPEQDKEKLLLTELASVLYERQILSFGKARELAKMTKWEFDEVLSERKIERHYNEENASEDLQFATNF